MRFGFDEMAEHRGHLSQMQNSHKPRSNFLGSATKSKAADMGDQGHLPRRQLEPTTHEKAPKFTHKTIDFFFHRTRKSKVDCQERQVQSRAPTSNATFLPPTCGTGPFHKTRTRRGHALTNRLRTFTAWTINIENELGIDEQGRGNPTFVRPGHRQPTLPLPPIILYRSSKTQRSPRPTGYSGRHFGGARRLWLCIYSPELDLWLLGLSKVLFVLSY